MPNVPEDTIEAETDYDYAYSYPYDYGILDSTLAAIAQASLTTTATATASGDGQATTTADATTTANATATGDAATTATATPQTTASTTTTSIAQAITTNTATTTAAAIATDAESTVAPTEFRVTRGGTTVEDAVFDVDPLTDTANPFGDYAVIKIDDSGGQKFENYERGTRIDVAISTNGGISFQDRFTGYVVERRETEQQGADALEVEAYSFDQFLRRNTVTNDQTGNLISEALADIIQTDTPVTYNAANVTVGDDQELTRSYQGVTVENVLRDLAFKSNNETFRVTDDLEFVFQPRETTHIDRGIDNTEWFNYDIPELGKEAINEVEVWFDDGNRSVIVDDGPDKLDLQDTLGLPSPGTQRAELNRPLITNINDAEDIGRKYLAFKNATLSGTVTTFGLYDAEPGDTIDITIDPRGIDDEFVIAAIEYRWGVDETVLTIVEKRGDVDDILSDLTDSVQRVEMNGADRDAPKNRITTTNATAQIDISTDADGNTPAANRLVNSGRQAIRDAWTGETPPDIAEVVVGSDGSGLSRSNTDLNTQTNSAAVSQTLPDAKSVAFSASLTQTGVKELGVKAADGTLITRETFETAVDLNGTVTVTLTVSNDKSVSRGVLTDDGQTAVRDVLAANSPAIPTDYGYGTDGSAVAETDTALGNEIVSVGLDDVLLGRVDSQSDWDNAAPTFADDYPLTVQNGKLTPLQTTYLTETEDLNNFAGNQVTNADVPGVLSDDAGIQLEIVNDFVQFDFSPEYRIPANEWTADLYYTSNNFTGTYTKTINGTEVETTTFNSRTVENQSDGSAYVDIELSPDETYSYRVELTSVSSGTITIDTMQAYDTGNRAAWSTNRSGTFDANFASFDAPELYPDLVEAKLAKFPTRRDITEARADITIDDTSNEQYIELSNDDSTYIRTNNSSTATAAFANPNRGLFVRLGLSRYGGGSVTTPTSGRFGQDIDLVELFGNPDAVVADAIDATLTRAVVAPGTATGATIREAGLKNGATLLTHHQLADFDVLAGQRISSSETTRFTGN